jgi:Cys-tRNA(Pro)/Cys-tRNA(Cys) deacylase
MPPGNSNGRFPRKRKRKKERNPKKGKRTVKNKKEMAKKKEIKTNAMRILDRTGTDYRVITYECDEFVDAQQIADQLHQPHEKMYKTLVTKGRSGDYFVFVIPIDGELDLKKAAKSVGEKSVEMIHVKDINAVTGYIRGGCTPIGMKKQYMTRISEEAGALDTMIVSGGKLGAQIELRPEDLIRVSEAEYADLLE